MDDILWGVWIKTETTPQPCPPPLMIYIVSLFFCNSVYFESIGEKYAYFLPNGGKICIYPPTPFNNPQHVIFFFIYLFIFIYFFGGGGQTEKYTPLK